MKSVDFVFYPFKKKEKEVIQHGQNRFHWLWAECEAAIVTERLAKKNNKSKPVLVQSLWLQSLIS